MSILGVARVVPSGWFGLSRYTGDAAERPERMGLYCSVACLVAEVLEPGFLDRGPTRVEVTGDV